MKRAALVVAVLMAIPLAAVWAQSDPDAPAAGDPAAAQAAPADTQAPGDTQAAPADPQPAYADPAPAPARDAAATDPDPAGDPDAAGNVLPATASHGPLILLMGLLAIGMFVVLKVFRRRSVDVS